MANVVSYDRPTGTGRPEFSIPSIIAIAAAIGSFFFGAGLGMLLAIIAIAAGVIGLLLALSPRVRGGMMSIVSILFGLVGIIAAVIKLFVH
jgi:hypothetical protein